MTELLALHASKIKGFARGQKIEAKVLEINKKYALFDVGGKSEGILKDIYFQEARDYLRTLKVGDKVNANVMDSETSDGNVLLSLRHAASDSQWAQLEEVKNERKTVNVNIKSSNNSGISVEYEGIFGFIPTSQIGKETLKKISKLVGPLKVKVIEVDRE